MQPRGGAHLGHSGHSGENDTVSHSQETRDPISATRRPPPSQWANTYSEDEADDLEAASEGASLDNIRSALDRLKSFLEGASIQYAVQGGYAMKLHGFEDRDTVDLDITIGSSIADLVDALSGTASAIRHHEQVSMQLGVGGTILYVDVDGIPVHVDLLLASDVLGSDDVESADTIDGYKVLPLHSLFKTKLKSFEGRGDDKDYDDLIWLYEVKGSMIRNFTKDMSVDQKAEFMDAYADREDDEKVKALADFLHLKYRDIDDRND